MGKITVDQSHAVMAILATNVDWGAIDFDASELQAQVIRDPQEAGRRFTIFLQHGTRIVQTIVHVNRSDKPSYPDWLGTGVVHSNLECAGPVYFDLAKDVSLWFHDDQKGNVTTGDAIYAFLKEHGMIESCLSLQDALAIQKMGITMFQRVFGFKRVCFWKSVVRDSQDGRSLVPYLHDVGHEVVLHWVWLDHDWRDCMPAARFASPSATPEN